MIVHIELKALSNVKNQVRYKANSEDDWDIFHNYMKVETLISI